MPLNQDYREVRARGARGFRLPHGRGQPCVVPTPAASTRATSTRCDVPPCRRPRIRARDTADTPRVAVVNQTMADRYLARPGRAGQALASAGETLGQVVGSPPTASTTSSPRRRRDFLFLAGRQDPAVRDDAGRRDARRHGGAGRAGARAVIAALDRELPITGVVDHGAVLRRQREGAVAAAHQRRRQHGRSSAWGWPWSGSTASWPIWSAAGPGRSASAWRFGAQPGIGARDGDASGPASWRAPEPSSASRSRSASVACCDRCSPARRASTSPSTRPSCRCCFAVTLVAALVPARRGVADRPARGAARGLVTMLDDAHARTCGSRVDTCGRRRGGAAAAILTLMLGIAASTAMFALVDGVLLRPLPVRDQPSSSIVWREPRGRAARTCRSRAPEWTRCAGARGTLTARPAWASTGAGQITVVERGSASDSPHDPRHRHLLRGARHSAGPRTRAATRGRRRRRAARARDQPRRLAAPLRRRGGRHRPAPLHQPAAVPDRRRDAARARLPARHRGVDHRRGHGLRRGERDVRGGGRQRARRDRACPRRDDAGAGRPGAAGAPPHHRTGSGRRTRRAAARASPVRRRRGRRRPAGGPRALRRGGPGAAPGLRQRRHAAADARRSPPARARGARGARRQPQPPRAVRCWSRVSCWRWRPPPAPFRSPACC